MTSTVATVNDILVPGELVPAEVSASLRRQGDFFPRKPSVAGSTVNDLGHINNYAVYPQKYAVTESSDDEKFRQGVIFAIATWVPIAIAVLVS